MLDTGIELENGRVPELGMKSTVAETRQETEKQTEAKRKSRLSK